jgi:hypothetical protein
MGIGRSSNPDPGSTRTIKHLRTVAGTPDTHNPILFGYLCRCYLVGWNQCNCPYLIHGVCKVPFLES